MIEAHKGKGTGTRPNYRRQNNLKKDIDGAALGRQEFARLAGGTLAGR